MAAEVEVEAEGAGPGPEQRPGWPSPGPLPPPDWASAVLGPGQAVHWRTQERESVSQGGKNSKNKTTTQSCCDVR